MRTEEASVFYPPRSDLLRRLIGHGRDMPPEIRARMHLSMFGSSDVAFAGMACAMFNNVFEIILLRSLSAAILVGLNLAATLTRIWVWQRLGVAQAAGRPTPTDAFLWSLGAWCLVQGMTVMVAVLSNVDAVQMTTFVVIVALASSFSVRQYATGAFVLVLMALTYLPITLGVLLDSNHWLLPLLPLMAVAAYSNYSTVLNMQTVTRDSLIAQRESYHLARHDPLTGVLNRFGLQETLVRLKVNGVDEFAIFCLDLDGFKQINDTQGHMAGDLILCSVAARLAATARPGDFVARLGGDEFLLLAPGMIPEEAVDFAACIRGSINGKCHEVNKDEPVPIDVSVGFACAPQDGVVFPALYHVADAGLYAAKLANRRVAADAKTYR